MVSKTVFCLLSLSLYIIITWWAIGWFTMKPIWIVRMFEDDGHFHLLTVFTRGYDI